MLHQAILNLIGQHHPTYPSRAGFKVTGTSLEAAESVTPSINEAHEQLIALLRIYPDGLTADNAGALLGWTQFYARPRMSELRARGLVKAVGRAVNPSGKAANVWGLV